MALISSVVFILLLAYRAEATSEWEYNPAADSGPEHWADQFPICNDRMQSPIDIQTDDVVVVVQYKPFSFTGYDVDGENPGIIESISNVGHTATMFLDGFFGVSGGGLHTEYEAVQIHFHWGISDDVGSEHKIDSKQFPLEMHVVSYAYEWFNGSIFDSVISGNHEALAVLSVLFEVGEEENSNYEEVITGISNVEHQNDDYIFQNQVSLAKLLPEDTSRFYRYNGSLTTPECFEVVTWTVFKDTVKLSHKQLETFRKLREGDNENSHLTGNTFRPTQLIRGRTVYYSSATSLRAVMPVVMIALLRCAYFSMDLWT